MKNSQTCLPQAGRLAWGSSRLRFRNWENPPLVTLHGPVQRYKRKRTALFLFAAKARPLGSMNQEALGKGSGFCDSLHNIDARHGRQKQAQPGAGLLHE